MRSLTRGKNILVSVENITPFGIWFLAREKEYFLSYKVMLSGKSGMTSLIMDRL